MRVCIKHFEKATEVLVSKMTGTEYDLCDKCLKELHNILIENIIEVDNGRNRVAGRPKTTKG